MSDKIEKFEELLELLLERSESDQGLDAVELAIVVRRMREMFDVMVRLATAVRSIPDTRVKVLHLLKTARTLRQRCGLAFMFIELGRYENAARLLRPVADGRMMVPGGSLPSDDES